MDKLLAVLPFSGFYESIHAANLDDTLEQLFQNDQGDIDDKGIELLNAYTGWTNELLANYCKLYVEAFNHELSLNLVFESLESPKFYNYTTDRIFIEIAIDELKAIYDKTDKGELAKLVKSKFTSYDGFSSFYSNDLSDWPSLLDWDHNQIGTLVECYLDQEDSDFELYSMESASCNGDIDTLIWESFSNEYCEKVNNYIENVRDN